MQHEGEDHSILEDDSQDEAGDSPEDESDSSSLSVPNEHIDFDLVYALHTFVATTEGQANVIKGDSLFLMDDSDSYWWFVRVLKTQEVGYVPADNIEDAYERLGRLNKHRNVDVSAATPEERTFDPKAYRAHQAHLASQQYHSSHPSHPYNVRKRSVSFRGSSTRYHYPPEVWGEEEQLGWEEEDYEGYGTGVDQPLKDEIRVQRQQRYKSRDARTLHHTLQQLASDSTLQQQTSNSSLRLQDYEPSLRRQSSRKARSPFDLRPNNSPGSVLSGGGRSSTASDNVAPKVFDLAALGSNETRKISATPPLASEGGTGEHVPGMNNGELAVPLLPSANLAHQENERQSGRYGGHSYRDVHWKPVEGGTPKGGRLSKTSEKEAPSAQKPEKAEEVKSWKKGSIFRGLFGGNKEKDRTRDEGAAGAVNEKRSEEYYETLGLVTTNEEGGRGGRVNTSYSTEPPEQGQGVGSTESYGKQRQGVRVRHVTRKPPPAYQLQIETAPESTTSQPFHGLQTEGSFLHDLKPRSGRYGRLLSREKTRYEDLVRDGMSGPVSTRQSVERRLPPLLKGSSGGSASAMVLEVVSTGIGGSGLGTDHQHLGDRSDIKKHKVTEGRVHGKPLPPLINGIPPRTEGRGPRRTKGGNEEGIAAPPVLAISGPGDDAEVDKVYEWNNAASEDQEEKTRPTLETLMQTRIPLDLTGQVVVSDYRRPAHGGLAVVYPGLWNDSPVAVKLLKFQKDGGADAYWDVSNERRVRREISVWAALKHPNITEFLGYSTDLADFPAMISRWCERGNVLEHLKRQALSVNQRMKLAQDVSRGLEYLHQLKVVHGDVKPANILVDDEGLAKLCDFGLVRLVDWDGPAGMTTTSPYTGTERYKAPELFVTAENRRPVATFAGDTYSLGCIMLEFIERIYPFQRFTKTYELRDAIMDGYAPTLRSETTHALMDLTDSFWNLLEACWAEPPDRPSTTVIVDALDDFARTMPGSP